MWEVEGRQKVYGIVLEPTDGEFEVKVEWDDGVVANEQTENLTVEQPIICNNCGDENTIQFEERVASKVISVDGATWRPEHAGYGEYTCSACGFEEDKLEDILQPETKVQGHYTFQVNVAVPADDEDAAGELLYDLLSVLNLNDQIMGFDITKLARDLTYDAEGNLLKFETVSDGIL